ncbi:hypothetical protein ACHAPU_002233 [Fusarium lateritium]
MPTTNPNTTSKNRNTFSDWPSFLTANTKSVCSSTTIPINQEFYTNNTALKYTVTRIWQGEDPKSPDTLLGSLPYLSNPLQDCSVNGITIEFEGIDRSASQMAVQQWGAMLRASVSCDVITPSGRTTMNMTTSYDYNGKSNDAGSHFPGRNETTKASLWWGESLLAWYSIAVTNDMHTANDKFSQGERVLPVYKGQVSFSKRKTVVPSVEDVQSLEFLQVSCFFVPFSTNGVTPNVYYCDHEMMNNTNLIEKLSKANETDTHMPLPGIWQSANSLAKAFYFTILADLGQKDSGPNILDNADLLAFSTQGYEGIRDRKHIWGDNLMVNTTSGLAHRSFTSKDDSAKHLGIGTSVISTTFICQIPRLKSTPSLVVSVIINTMVIVSGLWTLYRFSIDAFVSSRHPELQYCTGCATGIHKGIENEATHVSEQDTQSMELLNRAKDNYTSVRQEEER